MSLAQHVTQSQGFDYEALPTATDSSRDPSNGQTTNRHSVSGPTAAIEAESDNNAPVWREMSFAPADQHNETQPRTAAYNVSTTKRCAQIVIGVIACWLASGIVFGFAALKPVLIKEGLYHELCEPGEKIPCAAQDMRLNIFFVVASITANISCLAAGILLDRFGRRLCWVSSCASLSLGSILMAVSSRIQGFDGYILGNIMLSLGGVLLFVPSFELANAFPKYSGLIVALVTGAYDASAAVFLVYQRAYEALGGRLSLDKFFLGYLIVPALIFVAEYAVMPSHPYHTLAQLDVKIDQVMDSTLDVHGSDDEISDHEELIRVRSVRADKRHAKLDQLEGVAGDAEQRESRVKMEEDRQESSGVWGVLHGLPIHRQILTPWYLLILALTMVQMLRMNYLIATIAAQYRYMLQSDSASERINRFFDIALPVGGVVSTPFIGLLLNNVSVPATFGVMTLFIVAIGVFNCIPYTWAGYVTVVAFVLFRPLYYSAISDYATKVFGFASFGRIYGTIVCGSGLVNFAQPGLDALTHKAFRNDPVPINMTLGVIGTVIGLILTAYTAVKGRQFSVDKLEADKSLEQQRLLAEDSIDYGSRRSG